LRVELSTWEFYFILRNKYPAMKCQLSIIGMVMGLHHNELEELVVIVGLDKLRLALQIHSGEYEGV
jgi:hypothetical protein